MKFDHPNYKGSSLFRRPSRMLNKINLNEKKNRFKTNPKNLPNKQLLNSKRYEESH